jgi:hypothetical protein
MRDEPRRKTASATVSNRLSSALLAAAARCRSVDDNVAHRQERLQLFNLSSSLNGAAAAQAAPLAVACSI